MELALRILGWILFIDVIYVLIMWINAKDR